MKTEPDPIKNIRQFTRDTYLPHRIFHTHDDLVGMFCRNAPNQRIDQPWRIMPFSLRNRAGRFERDRIGIKGDLQYKKSLFFEVKAIQKEKKYKNQN
ncbi:MAG: hypothetical protein ABF990_06780 [Acetobacter sp.]|uniref:hypothetical protein n=1 Tax=Acetobacter sp. TaxID=440 RepID=UPI0039EA6016